MNLPNSGVAKKKNWWLLNHEIELYSKISTDKISRKTFSYTIRPVKQVFKRKIAIVFLIIGLNMCFGCSKEPSHQDGSLSTHNICFGREIRKIIFTYAQT